MRRRLFGEASACHRSTSTSIDAATGGDPVRLIEPAVDGDVAALLDAYDAYAWARTQRRPRHNPLKDLETAS